MLVFCLLFHQNFRTSRTSSNFINKYKLYQDFYIFFFKWRSLDSIWSPCVRIEWDFSLESFDVNQKYQIICTQNQTTFDVNFFFLAGYFTKTISMLVDTRFKLIYDRCSSHTILKKKNQNRNTSNNIVSFLFCMNSGISFKILFLTGAEKETGIRHVLQKCWMVWEMGVMHVSKGTRLHWIPRINKQIRCGSLGNYTSFLLFLQYFNRSACKVHGTRKSKIQTREKKN